MKLLVKLMSGPGTGRSVEVEAGQLKRFGQAADFCDLAFAWDTYAALAHFDVVSEAGGWKLRDHGSFAGTFINGARVSGSAEVKPGDRILAGRTLLAVSLAGVDEQPSQQDLALKLLRQVPEPLFALLDAARDGRVVELMGACDAGCLSLFGGREGGELGLFAPYLLELKAESAFCEMLVHESWGKRWGVFLSSRTALFQLRIHLRQILLVTDEQGRDLLFRFYDPSVLRTYLPTCSETEWRSVFGPVARYLIESEDGKDLLLFNFNKPGPPQSLSVSP